MDVVVVTIVVVTKKKKKIYNRRSTFFILFFWLDERRSYNHRSPYERPAERNKEDELEDIEIRLKGLIIKIGDKVKIAFFFIEKKTQREKVYT